jgi:hypothetical protein
VRHICRDSLSRHIITSSELGARLDGLMLDLKVIDPELLAQGSGNAPKLDAPIESWDTHGIIYTSGTTETATGKKSNMSSRSGFAIYDEEIC